MMLFVNLMTTAAAALCMYRYVRAFNAKLATEDADVALARSLDPTMIAIGTFLLAIFTVPYAFYRTKGPAGIAIGIAVLLGMGACSLMTRVALGLVLGALDPPSSSSLPLWDAPPR